MPFQNPTTRRNFDSNRLFSLEYEDELIIEQVREVGENRNREASENSASLVHEHSGGTTDGDATTMPRYPFLKFRL